MTKGAHDSDRACWPIEPQNWHDRSRALLLSGCSMVGSVEDASSAEIVSCLQFRRSRLSQILLDRTSRKGILAWELQELHCNSRDVISRENIYGLCANSEE